MYLSIFSLTTVTLLLCIIKFFHFVLFITKKKTQLQLLQVMGSAVELLEVMLEETSPISAIIKKGLQEAVDVECLLQAMFYFHEMSCSELVRKEEMDDDAIRGKFRSYHALVALSDSDSKIGGKTIGKSNSKLPNVCTIKREREREGK